MRRNLGMKINPMYRDIMNIMTVTFAGEEAYDVGYSESGVYDVGVENTYGVPDGDKTYESYVYDESASYENGNEQQQLEHLEGEKINKPVEEKKVPRKKNTFMNRLVSGVTNTVGNAVDAVNKAFETGLGEEEEEELDKELAIVDVETIEEGLREIEYSFPNVEKSEYVVSEMKICSKNHRLKFGREVDGERKKVNEAAAELDRILSDKYDSQFKSKIEAAKDALRLAEHYHTLAKDRFEVYAFGNTGASILSKIL